MIDLLSSMIASINRASSQRQLSTLCPNNKLIRDSLLLLHRLGFIRGFVVLNEKHIRIFLKYYQNFPVIRMITRVSKPGNRVYTSYTKWNSSYTAQNFRASSSLSTYILTTSQGLMTHNEAVSKKWGGEILFVIN